MQRPSAKTQTPRAKSRTPKPRDMTWTVYTSLRESILNGALPPGESLSQVQLATKLGVSRGPLREAVRMLQREGLVEAEVNRRGRVSSFSIDDLEQLYAMRIVHESLAIRITSRDSPSATSTRSSTASAAWRRSRATTCGSGRPSIANFTSPSWRTRAIA